MTKSGNSDASFFRQSGWMIMASTSSGIFMFAVHFFAPVMGQSEYGLLGTLLQMLNLMMIPALGLQSVFAQQSASAKTSEELANLAATVRGILVVGLSFWFLAGAVVFLFCDSILDSLKITTPAALWITVVFGLPQLWLPVFQGVLQGRQDFWAMGWISILNGIGRLAAIAVIVLLFQGKTAGAMMGALIGQTIALIWAIVQLRKHQVLTLSGGSLKLIEWLRRVAPLTLGLGVGQFMLAADMIFVRNFFDPALTGNYTWAGMMGRGLVMFSAPLVWVMFPKVVAAQRSGQNQHVKTQALMATAGLGALLASALTLVSILAPQLVQGAQANTLPIPGNLLSKIRENHDTILAVAKLIPWFVWSMLPLSVAIVLINDLLARSLYRAVPWLMGIAALYALTLYHYHRTFEQVILTLGFFSALLGVVAWIFSTRTSVALPKEETVLHGD